MDSTYKTNRFNMPLLNICAVTGNNMVIQVGLVFMSGEKKADYKWAMEQLKEVIEENSILVPTSIVTDRELALMDAIDKLFPAAAHFLCRWHVNMNVLAKTKKFFPKPVRGNDGVYRRHQKFKDFLMDWNALLLTTSKTAYDNTLKKMEAVYDKGAMSYVTSTWLIFQEKLVKLWVDQHLHFGYLVTSPVEGCHAGLKKYLQRSTASLDGVFEKLQEFWIAQHDRLQDTVAQQANAPRHAHQVPLFQAVLQFVHGFALSKVLVEVAKLPKEGLLQSKCPPEGCIIQRCFGLPCQHKIYHRKQSHGTLFVSDFHPYWLIQRVAVQPTQAPNSLILEPDRLQGRGRPRGALGGASREAESSTRRLSSTFELPPSTAPAALGNEKPTATAAVHVSVTNGRLPLCESIFEPAQPPLRRYNTRSTTAIALERIEMQGGDQYEPGTVRERGYMQGIRGIWHDEGREEDGDTIVVEVPIAGVGTGDLSQVIEEACGVDNALEYDEIGNNNTINEAVEEELGGEDDNEAVRLMGEILSRKEGVFTGDNWVEEAANFVLVDRD
jgi:hypothetical protein